MSVPVPWDTTELIATLDTLEWKRLFLTQEEQCIAFDRSWSKYGWCGLEYFPNCYSEYDHSSTRENSTSLFFEHATDIPYLRCLVALEYPRYVQGQLTSQPWYYSFSSPKVTLKLFHRDTLIERLAPGGIPSVPFDQDGFRALYRELTRYLAELSGDHVPIPEFKLGVDGCLPPRGYADLVGGLRFNYMRGGCIQANLKCLPVQPLIKYHLNKTTDGPWIYNVKMDQYWIDSTVPYPDQYEAKYRRTWGVEQSQVFDVRWEDLAIYVEVYTNRFEGQMYGKGDTIGRVPCPRITSLHVGKKQE